MRVPRVRGDEPGSHPAITHCDNVFPACAGMNRGPKRRRKEGAGVPRVRGDEPQARIAGQF